jgi:hypothetical protein
MFNENTRQFHRYLGAKAVEIRPPYVEEVQFYGKLLWTRRHNTVKRQND